MRNSGYKIETTTVELSVEWRRDKVLKWEIWRTIFIRILAKLRTESSEKWVLLSINGKSSSYFNLDWWGELITHYQLANHSVLVRIVNFLSIFLIEVDLPFPISDWQEIDEIIDNYSSLYQWPAHGLVFSFALDRELDKQMNNSHLFAERLSSHCNCQSRSHMRSTSGHTE